MAKTTGTRSTKAAGYPAVGSAAPAFKASTGDGRTVALADYKGKVVVLYFYPKDDTSGCTKEACGFRDAHRKLLDAGAVVLGVSPDSPASHEKFAGKYGLPFPLISDEDKSICRAYGVWQEKSMYGRKYMGVARTTFVIDRKGRIAHVFEKVKPAGHEEEVLAWVRSNLAG
ncbi:MAG: thioredoxin-dependent thiol peroxidase [Phycisphaerae bacterium]|jgi:peroxiredoxin Q/BCP